MFTVVIPYYNKAKYIQRCVDSVVNQTGTTYEIIIVNDGATDNGLEFLATKNDDKIRVIHQENKGVSEARIPESKTLNTTTLHFWMPMIVGIPII